MSYVIRKASLEDLKDIYSLVLELAEYEKEPEAVTATLKDYQQNFREKVFDAIVAEADGVVIGTCVYYLTWSTWKGRMMYLEDFVIREAHRRKGVGQLLFDEFLEISKKENAVMVKWQVLDWNEPAIKFYEKNEAIFDKGWWNVKIFF